jgi:hypothetical protein
LLAPAIKVVSLSFFVQSVMRRIIRIERECLAFFYCNLITGLRIVYLHIAFKDYELQRVLDRAGDAEAAGMIEKNGFVAHCHREFVVIPAGHIELGLSFIKVHSGKSAP